MAWLNEQTWFTYSSNIRLIGNIYISSITHTGTKLRIKGTIAAGARGSSSYRFYYSDYTSYAQPEGGNKIALGAKGRTWKVGDSDVHVDFDVTLSNVAASATSRSFYVNFYGPNTNSVKATLYWTVRFSASGSAPSDYSATNVSSNWDSITFDSLIGNTGGLALSSHCPCVSKIPLVGGASKYENKYTNTASVNTTVSNSSTPINSPDWTIKGCGYYYVGAFAENAAGKLYGQGPGTYTPPAPSTMTATDPGREGTKVYPVVFAGVVENNNATYDTSELTRTVRYKVDNADEWTYVVQDQEALIGAETTFTVRIPGSQSAVIEGWQTYHGLQSEVKTLTLYNGNAPSRVYGPVDGQSKLAVKLYGSVNGVSKEMVKAYGSVDGVSKAMLG